ncbi:MAG: small redox-active disulfide protein 2 [Paracoccaceae bacterium]|jgi:small redox-active disulfide protein 2
MIIKILGSGCRKCQALGTATEAAIAAKGVSATIEKVTDIVAITRYGVMSTPALVIDDKVVSTGKMLSAADIARLLPV